MKSRYVRRWLASPVGRMQLIASDEGLAALYFPDHRHERAVLAEESNQHAVLEQGRVELEEYFAGARRTFDVPLAPLGGGTPFQRRVWDALVRIPFGHTLSYRALAETIGSPSAVRAVGSANGHNPLSILVPCHRVVASAGALTGYGGGLPIKRWLLAHEGVQLRGDRVQAA